jgi:hypothetical protein
VNGHACRPGKFKESGQIIQLAKMAAKTRNSQYVFSDLTTVGITSFLLIASMVQKLQGWNYVKVWCAPFSGWGGAAVRLRGRNP